MNEERVVQLEKELEQTKLELQASMKDADERSLRMFAKTFQEAKSIMQHYESLKDELKEQAKAHALREEQLTAEIKRLKAQLMGTEAKLSMSEKQSVQQDGLEKLYRNKVKQLQNLLHLHSKSSELDTKKRPEKDVIHRLQAALSKVLLFLGDLGHEQCCSKWKDMTNNVKSLSDCIRMELNGCSTYHRGSSPNLKSDKKVASCGEDDDESDLSSDYFTHTDNSWDETVLAATHSGSIESQRILGNFLKEKQRAEDDRKVSDGLNELRHRVMRVVVDNEAQRTAVRVHHFNDTMQELSGLMRKHVQPPLVRLSPSSPAPGFPSSNVRGNISAHSVSESPKSSSELRRGLSSPPTYHSNGGTHSNSSPFRSASSPNKEHSSSSIQAFNQQSPSNSQDVYARYHQQSHRRTTKGNYHGHNEVEDTSVSQTMHTNPFTESGNHELAVANINMLKHLAKPRSVSPVSSTVGEQRHMGLNDFGRPRIEDSHMDEILKREHRWESRHKVCMEPKNYFDFDSIENKKLGWKELYKGSSYTP